MSSSAEGAPAAVLNDSSIAKQSEASLPALTSPSKPQQAPAARRDSANDSRVLKLKGLPYTTSEQQVLDFFAGYNVNEVAFVYEPDGRPSGLAFAEFATREEALQALSKNGEYLGDRYVRLLHVPKQEMEEQVRLGTLAIPGAQAKMRQKMMRGGGGMDALAGNSSGAHYGADALQQQMHGVLQGQPGGLQDLSGGHGGYPQHGGLPGLMQHVPHSMGQPGMGHHLQPGMSLAMGPGGGGGGMLPHPGMMQGMGEQHMQLQMANPQAGLPPHMALAYQLSGMGISGQARPTGNAMPGMIQVMPHGYAPAAASAAPMAVIGTDSKTIKIRGLPFRATPLDIFNFFENYAGIAESLQLGVDALGRPSGEAWLTFSSSDEALRAVRERNRHYLGNRYLELSLT